MSPFILSRSRISSLSAAGLLVVPLAGTACSSDDPGGRGDAGSSSTGGGASGAPGGAGGAATGTGGRGAGGGSAGSGGSGVYGAGGATGSGGAGDADAGRACVSETLTVPTGIPAALVPEGATLVHFLHARGTQTYECLPNPVLDDAGPPTFDWGTSAHNGTPEALVYDDCNVAKVHHFAGPTWEWIKDGSSVKGTKISAVAKPGTIPWLLLKATTVTPGKLSGVTFVQRLETTGGAPPATGCDAAHEGDKVSIDYTAGYYFYTGPADGG